MTRLECSKTVTNFFMTCRLTFCMSTFLLNSGGNLVDFKSRASTLEAMVGQIGSSTRKKARCRDQSEKKCTRRKSDVAKGVEVHELQRRARASME